MGATFRIQPLCTYTFHFPALIRRVILSNMNTSARLCCSLMTILVAIAGFGKTIDVTAYGARPNDGSDDTQALRAAVREACATPGNTLYFPKGTYILRDSAALDLERRVLNGEMGANPERTIFTPYYPYVKGLDFSGAQQLTVEARQATLMCEGWMEPVSLDHCDQVTIRGLTIDYLRKPFVSGEVTAVTAETFDVQFGDETAVTEKMPLTRLTFWENRNNRLYPEPIYFPKRELLGNNKVRFHHAIPERLKGSTVSVLNSFHFRPAILILRSVATVLEDVTIHAQPGMGVVGFDSKDIGLKRLSIKPANGYVQATNTDATHFACCEGTLRFQGCYFQGQGDDATNVHGYYQTIVSAEGSRATLKVMAGAYTHAQVADVPRVGDEMELVERRTLRPIRTYKVTEVRHEAPKTEVGVTLSEPLPNEISNYYLMNVTKLPRLIFEDSVINSHLARGILVKTRNVEIRNNLFRGCTGTAIHIGAEVNWHEGMHAKNVVVENNVMVGCGKGAGNQAGAAGISVIIEASDTSATYLHENIVLRDNLILGEGNPCGIYVGNAKNVTLTGNKIVGCERETRFHSVDELSVRP